jgi:hypothetical protein
VLPRRAGGQYRTTDLPTIFSIGSGPLRSDKTQSDNLKKYKCPNLKTMNMQSLGVTSALCPLQKSDNLFLLKNKNHYASSTETNGYKLQNVAYQT